MSKVTDVILVNEQDEPIGVMEKMEAHRKAVLHRAFSIFIFNSKGEMLLQQRAMGKYHSLGVYGPTPVAAILPRARILYTPLPAD